MSRWYVYGFRGRWLATAVVPDASMLGTTLKRLREAGYTTFYRRMR